MQERSAPHTLGTESQTVGLPDGRTAGTMAEDGEPPRTPENTGVRIANTCEMPGRTCQRTMASATYPGKTYSTSAAYTIINSET